MRAIVTCGPSFEPIDEVRLITNFSTGELGTLLAAALVRAGVETICLRGVAATWPERPAGADVRPFTTNDDLAGQLRQLTSDAPCDLLFHAAALADYRVASVLDEEGNPLKRAKISTGKGAVTLRLESAAKLLPQFRAWLPNARLFGWKYELDGTRDQAIARASRQIAECRTDACILNGRAWGHGFALLDADGNLEPVASKTELCDQLIRLFVEKSQKPLASSATSANLASSNRGVEQPGSSSGS